MKSMFKLLAALVLAFSTLAVSAPAALAAAPGNDTFAGATAAAIGFNATLNTSEATTDADDAKLNTDCGAPATDASL